VLTNTNKAQQKNANKHQYNITRILMSTNKTQQENAHNHQQNTMSINKAQKGNIDEQSLVK
jgi:hypothetical protein